MLRHAEAVPQGAAGAADDHARDLTPRGEAEATAVGAVLRAAGLVPDLVVTSDARRARRTAEIVVGADPWPLTVDPGVYEASPGRLVELVAALPETVASVLLVGHEPAVSGLAVALAGPSGRPDAGSLRAQVLAGLRTADAALLRWDGPWEAVGAACAELRGVLGP